MSYAKYLGENKWIIEVQSEKGTDELLLHLPEDAINQMGWAEGDEIEWIDKKDGSWMLKKKEDSDE